MTMPDTTYLVGLDDYHLGDPLFIDSLAQRMGRQPALPHCVFVHGGSEQAARALEAKGYFPEHHQGVPVPESAEQARIIEQAVRAVNRRIVGALTDAVVHAVGIQGSDRGVLRRTSDGAVTLGTAMWLAALVAQRVVPVVSTLVAPGPGHVAQPAPLHDVMLALAGVFETPTLVFLARGTAWFKELPPEVSQADLPPGACSAPESVQAVLDAGHDVLLTEGGRLFGGSEPSGIRIIPTKTP